MAKKSLDETQERLFEEKLVPARPGSGELFDVSFDADRTKPVECLGMKFPNDEARRVYFTEQLRERLKNPAFRKIEGFPIGDDKDVLALSNPPFYTACPNPFLGEFIEHYGNEYVAYTDDYHREPFATDVSEGKNDPIYTAHSYHTKVPHKAIMRYILHYTQPGDIVFDGFCGTGMTGVAAQLCEDRQTVQSLGLNVQRDGTILDQEGKVVSRLGGRRAILNDLAPAATFIAENFNRGMHFDSRNETFKQFVEAISQLEQDLWTVTLKGKRSLLAYIVWSDTFFCNNCSKEIIFWDGAVDEESGKVAAEITCPHCHSSFQKRVLQRPFISVSDPISKLVAEWPKLEPVLLGLADSSGKITGEVPTGGLRDSIFQQHGQGVIPFGFPDFPLDVGWEMYRHGMGKHRVKTNLHLYIPSSATTLNAIWNLIQNVPDYELQNKLRWVFTGIVFRCSKFNRRLPSGGGAPITGVLYIPSMIRQENPIRHFLRRLEDLSNSVFDLLPRTDGICGQTGALSGIQLPPNSLDYAFVDPPFGANIFYADMNFLWESWLRVFTNRKPEAIISDRALSGKKSIEDYGRLMLESFGAIYGALKPGRWMTVEFHNSSNAVWNVISEALQRSGFIVADVRTLDKKQKSFRQTTALGAVKQDLIISAYKPTLELERRFNLEAGSEKGAWEFVQSHLTNLPTFVRRGSRCEIIAERQDYMLFDRMVAFYVQRGASVPLSASEFYAGLRQRFPERDGMFFLPAQAAEYDRQRLSVSEVEQLALFVSDEQSAIRWVRQQLSTKALTYQDLSPLYMREAQRVWEKHEQPLELQDILDQNFVRDVDGCWRLPDLQAESDLEQLRTRMLLKEFEQYRETKGKLTVVRCEALRAGFKDCWQKQDYQGIVEMAKRLPETVIQEDPALLMYFDNALMRTGGQEHG